MRRILNISLGSSQRDFEGVFAFGKKKVFVKRIGCDGSIPVFKKLCVNINNYDGVALGGINADYQFADQTWPLTQYQQLKKLINRPVFDGSYIKNFYEPYRWQILLQQKPELQQLKWLFFSVLDRYPSYAFLKELKCNLLIGDGFAAFKVPIFLNDGQFKLVSKLFMPIFRHLPVQILYPHLPKTKRSPVFHKIKINRLARFDAIFAETNFLLNQINSVYFKGKNLVLSRATRKAKNQLLEAGAKSVSSLLPGEILSANIIEAMLALTWGIPTGYDKNTFEVMDSCYRIR